MNELKTFKVFYFLDETRRRWELIKARNEDEAEKSFKIAYCKALTDDKIFFGWVEEVF